MHPETQGIVSFPTHGQGRPPRSICACLIGKDAGSKKMFSHTSFGVEKKMQGPPIWVNLRTSAGSKKMFSSSSSGCYVELHELFRATSYVLCFLTLWTVFFGKFWETTMLCANSFGIFWGYRKCQHHITELLNRPQDCISISYCLFSFMERTISL